MKTRQSNQKDPFDAFVDYALEGGDAAPHIFIGPIVWKLKGEARRWYFSVVSGDANGFRADAFEAEDEGTAEAARNTVYMKFATRRPIILHEFDDELEMARWTDVVWPSERIKTIIRDIETERAQWAAEMAGNQ